MQAIGPDGTTAVELGRALGVSKQAAGKTIDTLESAGYVERTADPPGQPPQARPPHPVRHRRPQPLGPHLRHPARPLGRRARRGPPQRPRSRPAHHDPPPTPGAWTPPAGSATSENAGGPGRQATGPSEDESGGQLQPQAGQVRPRPGQLLGQQRHQRARPLGPAGHGQVVGLDLDVRAPAHGPPTAGRSACRAARPRCWASRRCGCARAPASPRARPPRRAP
ncbi:MarR family transcriptional regulator [Nonomuraea salmonea]|uniref:MarR family transcriptional regulator n=1 Tax=Nonomuraea salmonea TaxID=46181 RepID=UPI003CD07050